MSAYTEAVKNRNDLRVERDRLVAAQKQALAEFDRAIAGHQQVIGIAEAGGPADAFVVAREFLSIRWGRGRQWSAGSGWEAAGPRRRTAEVESQFDKAIEDVQAGCPLMKREYFGIKEYDSWPSQVENHRYGWAPAHGSIWFEIGLKDPRVDLSDEQRIACVQWLRALRENPELLP